MLPSSVYGQSGAHDVRVFILCPVVMLSQNLVVFAYQVLKLFCVESCEYVAPPPIFVWHGNEDVLRVGISLYTKLLLGFVWMIIALS